MQQGEFHPPSRLKEGQDNITWPILPVICQVLNRAALLCLLFFLSGQIGYKRNRWLWMFFPWGGGIGLSIWVFKTSLVQRSNVSMVTLRSYCIQIGCSLNRAWSRQGTSIVFLKTQWPYLSICHSPCPRWGQGNGAKHKHCGVGG